MRALQLVCVMILVSAATPAQSSYLDLVPAYIEKHKELAVEQMVKFRIPASVILAQAIKESGAGSSMLAQHTNNHFGIKCHREWGGATFSKDDDTLNECFRSYKSVEESYLDHSLFLLSRPRYASLLAIGINRYEDWCTGLKAAGYATAPNYCKGLIAIINRFRLYELDGTEPIAMKVSYESLAMFPDKEITKTQDFDNFLSAEKTILARVVFNQTIEKVLLTASINELAKNTE